MNINLTSDYASFIFGDENPICMFFWLILYLTVKWREETRTIPPCTILTKAISSNTYKLFALDCGIEKKKRQWCRPYTMTIMHNVMPMLVHPANLNFNIWNWGTFVRRSILFLIHHFTHHEYNNCLNIICIVGTVRERF